MNDSGDPWILLRRVLGALTEGYPHVTLIGGWAFRVYALHPDARPVHGAPIATLDADLVLSPKISRNGEANVPRSFERSAAFAVASASSRGTSS